MQASSGNGKCSKIRHIVCLRQMLRRWRAKAWMSSPVDVPSGHVAVRVGADRRTFVVRATDLNHPMFRKLQGPLTIPCDEELFEGVVRFISRSESGMVDLEGFQLRHHRHCHVGLTSGWDGRPLLPGVRPKDRLGNRTGRRLIFWF